jgi:hypothetical protein
VDGVSDLALWDLGVSMCEAFDAGVTMEAYLAGMAEDDQPLDIVYAFPVGAVTYICPRHQPIIDEYDGK